MNGLPIDKGTAINTPAGARENERRSLAELHPSGRLYVGPPIQFKDGHVVRFAEARELRATTSNTDWSSVGEVLIILRTSAVAVCCSCASCSSRVSRATSVSWPAAEER